MQELRPLLHEIMNALSISRGLAEGVLDGMKGNLELSPAQKIDKLERAIRAMDRIEAAAQEIRSHVIGKNEGKV